MGEWSGTTCQPLRSEAAPLLPLLAPLLLLLTCFCALPPAAPRFSLAAPLLPLLSFSSLRSSPAVSCFPFSALGRTSGDVTKPRVLPHVLARAKAVILLASGAPSRPGEPGPEEVDHLGVDNVAQAALKAGVGRLLLLSRIGASRPFGWARASARGGE